MKLANIVQAMHHSGSHSVVQTLARLCVVLLAIVLIVSCQLVDGPSSAVPSEGETSVAPSTEWLFSLDELEERIIFLTNQALQAADPQGLYQLKHRLMGFRSGDSIASMWARDYWHAFLNFNLMRVELYLHENSQVKLLLNEAIDTLVQSTSNSVEKEALLAILYHFQIGQDPANTFAHFTKMQDHLDAAVATDELNLRTQLAQVIIATNPIEGFRIDIDVEETVDQVMAQSMESPQSNDVAATTWGKSLVYQYWIDWLDNKGQREVAKNLIQQAIEEFPDDFFLQLLHRQMTPM